MAAGTWRLVRCPLSACEEKFCRLNSSVTQQLGPIYSYFCRTYITGMQPSEPTPQAYLLCHLRVDARVALSKDLLSISNSDMQNSKRRPIFNIKTPQNWTILRAVTIVCADSKKRSKPPPFRFLLLVRIIAWGLPRKLIRRKAIRTSRAARGSNSALRFQEHFWPDSIQQHQEFTFLEICAQYFGQSVTSTHTPHPE